MGEREVQSPLPTNGLGKFSRPEVPCAPGVEVVDTTLRTDGVDCCSYCRGGIEVREGRWVHQDQPNG